MQATFATSDECWPNFICSTCGGKAGDSDNSGVIVRGGYGSTRYDTYSLIWIVRGDKIYPPGYICDDCIDRAVAAGFLEQFHSAIHREETGLHFSEAAYHELFAYGARKAYDEFWARRDDSPYQEATAPSELEQAILDIRQQLIGDEILSSSASIPRSPLGWHAVNIGYAHAVAAIAFGCGEADPGFEKAADAWARGRRALDHDLDENWVATQQMLGQIGDMAE